MLAKKYLKLDISKIGCPIAQPDNDYYPAHKYYGAKNYNPPCTKPCVC